MILCASCPSFCSAPTPLSQRRSLHCQPVQSVLKTQQTAASCSPAAVGNHKRSIIRAVSALPADKSGNAAPVIEGPSATASFDVDGEPQEITLPIIAEGNALMGFALKFPLGLVLEYYEAEKLIKVAEITDGGNAAAAKIQVGDILRAATGAAMQMRYDTVGLLMGGDGRPRKVKTLQPTTGRGFEWCMGAIRSCRDMGGEVGLVLERPAAK